MGIVFKDGVILATVKHLIDLMVPTSSEKIFQIDDHVGAVAAGYLADARMLTTYARIRAQVHRITYEEPIDVWGIAKVIGDRMQISTLYAGLRPFGVSLLIGGWDVTGTHLIESDPSGMLFEWFAYSIGRGSTVVNKLFKQKWKPKMDKEAAIKLAIEGLTKVEKNVSEKNVEIVVLEKDKKFRKLKEDEVKKFFK